MTAGIRGRTVIVNFPGSKKASAECFGFVEAALTHAVDLLRGDGNEVDKTHRELQGEVRGGKQGGMRWFLGGQNLHFTQFSLISSEKWRHPTTRFNATYPDIRVLVESSVHV